MLILFLALFFTKQGKTGLKLFQISLQIFRKVINPPQIKGGLSAIGRVYSRKKQEEIRNFLLPRIFAGIK